MVKKDNCGCDNDYFSLINSSPILSGSQENAFDPGYISNFNNNFNLEVNETPIIFDKKNSQMPDKMDIPDINLDIIPQKKINDNNINMNVNNPLNNIAFSNNNLPNNNVLQQLNNLNGNGGNVNGVNVNGGNMNSGNMNGGNMNGGNMNGGNVNGGNVNGGNVNGGNVNGGNMNGGNVNGGNVTGGNVTGVNVNGGNVTGGNGDNGNNKDIFSKYNYILLIIVALAWNDIIKYYINRAIKFNNGTHHYYLYYGISVTVLIFITSKILQKI